ncbi:hypothetical protein ILYODFUR_018371 [Ilyodon furcidens]|uniref:Secreted protein n=1 Tax=Ilyodon furcidens TaxID=33524 RepID=A0ABV0SY43_9TELE
MFVVLLRLVATILQQMLPTRSVMWSCTGFGSKVLPHCSGPFSFKTHSISGFPDLNQRLSDLIVGLSYYTLRDVMSPRTWAVPEAKVHSSLRHGDEKVKGHPVSLVDLIYHAIK